MEKQILSVEDFDEKVVGKIEIYTICNYTMLKIPSQENVRVSFEILIAM
jgi:hypothetical protein